MADSDDKVNQDSPEQTSAASANAEPEARQEPATPGETDAKAPEVTARDRESGDAERNAPGLGDDKVGQNTSKGAARASANAEPDASVARPEPATPGATDVKAQEGAARDKAPGDAERNAPGPGKEGDASFNILDQALKNADWGYDRKFGNDRELGHRSVIIAEKAFIHASLHDDKRAAKMFEDTTGRPPKEDLLKRVAEARVQGAGSKLDDLTAGIINVGEQREINHLRAKKDEIDQKAGNWKVAIGDAEARGIQHRKAGNEEMLKDERHRDDGMHVFSAFRSGLRAAEEYRQMGRSRSAHSELKKNTQDHSEIYGAITTRIAEYDKKNPDQANKMGLGLPAGRTTGPTGKAVGRFGGAYALAGKVVNARRAAEQKKAAVTTGPEVGVEPGRAAPPTMAKAAGDIARSMGQGMGR